MMIISNLGQSPTRDPFRDRSTEAVPQATLTPDGRGEYLYTAEIIAGLIAKHYESGLNLGRDKAIKMADAEIRPDQRFWIVEFEQAGEILAARSPLTETAQNWTELMKIFMKARMISILTCKYGQETDPVTRLCVTKTPERWEAHDTSVVSPTVGKEPNGEKDKTSSLILPLGIVGVFALLMLGGSR